MRKVIDPHVVLFWVEAYFQGFDQLGTTPEDSHNTVLDSPTHHPFFDSNRHGRLVDCRWTIVPRQFWNALLMRSCRKLLHLRRRRGVLVRERHGVYPLDTSTSIPARHNESDRSTVISRKSLAVHLSRQKGFG